MLPLARIVHQTRSRARLRIGEKRKDPEYFEQAGEQLGTVAGISGLRINSDTGSILLLHPEQPWAELETELQQLGLFKITGAPEPGTPALEPLRFSISTIDEAIIERSSGRVDLKTIAFIGLMGFTLSQLARGRVLGPALPMLFNALSLVNRLDLSGLLDSPEMEGEE